MTAEPLQGIPGRTLPLLLAGAAFGAAASLLVVGEPTSRDANNWLIWARQLALGNDLWFGGGTPSWKPLPVILALPAAAISPDLSDSFWLWLVRFSWLACPILLADLAIRRFGRIAAVVAASLPLALTPWFAYALMGESEPVAAAASLAALVLAVRGGFRLPLVLLTAAGMLRPELWPLLPLLIAWRWRSARSWREAAIATGISGGLLAFSWALLPAIAGGGASQAADRASTRLLVASPANGFLSLLPTRIWLLVAVGLVGIALRRDRVLALMAVCSFALGIEVEVMGLLGFSALDRYGMPGAIALCAIGGAGAATLVDAIAAPWWRLLAGIGIAASVITLIIAALPLDRENVRRRSNQGESAQRAISAFERAGGRGRFAGCLPLATNGAWSAMIARMAGLPLDSVTNHRPAPTVVLQPLPARSSAANGPSIDPRGIRPRVVGYAAPDWAVILYPGCER